MKNFLFAENWAPVIETSPMLKRIESFKHAFRGAALFIRNGVNAKIQLLGALVALGTARLLSFAALEWICVILCSALVLALEAINSALESLADEVTEECRARIRDAKDMAAGAVLIASIASAVIYGVLVYTKLSGA